MRRLGLAAIYQRPNTSQPAVAHKIYPYLLGGRPSIADFGFMAPLFAHLGRDPVPAALAATFAASLGFMMPVSTPCNAIVYGTGRIRLGDMIRSGAILDVAGAVVITLAMLLVRGLWPS